MGAALPELHGLCARWVDEAETASRDIACAARRETAASSLMGCDYCRSQHRAMAARAGAIRVLPNGRTQVDRSRCRARNFYWMAVFA
jgi:alkylhydroperoxidase family enzyme